MGFFVNKNKGGLFDVIRCDEDSHLIWKWSPNNSHSKRENEIRSNSIIRVRDGEIAVFAYDLKNGSGYDYIIGPYEKTVKTSNFPVLSSIVGLAYNGESPFQAEVYFINTAKLNQIKFAVPYFDLCDPRFIDFPVQVAVRGSLNFCIEDYQNFIKIHRLVNLTLNDLELKVKSTVTRYIKNTLAICLKEKNIPLIQIETQVSFINDFIYDELKNILYENYGINLKIFDIFAIEIDKSSNEYIELKKVSKDIVLKTLERQTEANLINYEEQLKIQREELQYQLHKQTQTQNMEAYKVERQTEVGIASAEAFGKMGENNAGNIDIASGSGFNPVSIMAGMSVGSAIGKNLNATINESLSTDNFSQQSNINKQIYYVVLKNEKTGPFTFEKILSMIDTGEVNYNTLKNSVGAFQGECEYLGMTAQAGANTSMLTSAGSVYKQFDVRAHDMFGNIERQLDAIFKDPSIPVQDKIFKMGELYKDGVNEMASQAISHSANVSAHIAKYAGSYDFESLTSVLTSALTTELTVLLTEFFY